jgi:hypothetical protein
MKITLSIALAAVLAIPRAIDAQRKPIEPAPLTRIEHAPTKSRPKLDAATNRAAEYQVNGRITYLAASGDFEVSWDGADGKRHVSVFEPPNKVSAIVSADVTYDPASKLYTYTYTTLNRANSKRNLKSVYVRAAGVQRGSGPGDSWYSRKLTAFLTKRLGGEGWAWSDVLSGDGGGIRPGVSVSGFQLVSPYPPAPQPVFVEGSRTPPSATEDMPDELHAALSDPSLAFPKGWTMGPKAVEGLADSRALAAPLLADFEIMAAQGWFGGSATTGDIRRRLNEMRSAVAATDRQTAQSRLSSLLGDLRQNKHGDILSEGRALLLYRLPLLQDAIARNR